MNKKQSLFFFFLAGIFILSILIKPYSLSWLVKLLPMITLVLFALHYKVEKIFIVGLVFSGFGDFFLDYDRVNWFIFGLGAFFIAHICYMVALKPIEIKRMAIVTLYAAYGMVMFVLISGGLAELFVPVLAYMSILLLMAITTLIAKKSNKCLIIGGISFVISDSLIGINQFYMAIPYAHLLIMISYYFAQYTLLNGFIAGQQRFSKAL